MKQILIFYYTKEIHNKSRSSVPRLIASLISFLEEKYKVVFITFNSVYVDQQINTKPFCLNISAAQKVRRKINNTIGLKRITHFQLKQSSARAYFVKNKGDFDYILTLRLDDLLFLRKMNQRVRILYWIHDASTVHSKYLKAINYANDILSPSITTYKEILKKIQPNALISSFTFLPNWCAPNFKRFDESAKELIRLKYGLIESSVVFAYAGGDVPLKGGHLIKAVFKNINTAQQNMNITLIYIGGSLKADITLENGVRIIETGSVDIEDIAAIYNIATFGLMPSLGYDHAPLTLLEMISCNVLPIASNIGGIGEMLGTSYSMLIHLPNSKNEWTYRIQQALQLSASEYCNTLKNLKDRIANIYNAKNSFSIFEKLLNE